MHPNADKISIASNLTIKWKGTFDFDDLYKKLKYWLFFEGYGDHEKSFKEVKYVERISPRGKQYEIAWIGEKKRSDYFSFYITVEFFVVGLKDVEITHEGRKIKMNQADIKLSVSSDLVKNWQGKWDKNSWTKKVYENFIIKNRIEEYKLELYKKTYSFVDEIKSYLNMHRF